ncbi:MAG: hypothetical protein SV765_02690 [Pseudomonadota bacterium]|nr:hypothetical protein [Pseudomonadota bacterium]
MNNMDRVFLLLALLLLGAGYVQAQLQQATEPSSPTLQAPHSLGRQVALQGGFSLIRNVPAPEQTTAATAQPSAVGGVTGSPGRTHPVPQQIPQQSPYTF